MKRLSKETAMHRLMDIGLTETEARVYLALLGGVSDAKRLSQSAKVPYSKVHTLLRRLEEKGLVGEKGGRPRQYESLDPKEAMERYKKREEEALAVRMSQTEEALRAVVASGEAEKPDIWIIRGQEEILEKAYEALNRARERVELALPVVPEWAVAAFVPILTRLRAKEVSLKLLLPEGVSDEVFGRLSGLAEIRLRDRLFGGGIIVDDREALVVISGEEASLNLAIWSSHSGLIDLAKTYFDYLWRPEG